MKHRSDGRLIRFLSDARSGSDDALNDLLTYLYPILRRYVTGQLAYEKDARDLSADLVQEVLVRVLDGYLKCQAESEDQVIAWALTIARNTCIDRHRRRENTVRLESLEESEEPSTSLLEEYAGRPTRAPEAMTRGAALVREIVRRALGGLSADARLLVERRFTDGWTWLEISRETGATPRAVLNRYTRIRARLQREVRAEIELLGSHDRTAVSRHLRRQYRRSGCVDTTAIHSDSM